MVELQPYFDRVIRVMQSDAWSYSKAMQIMFPLSSNSPNQIRPLNERGTGLEGKETGAPLNADAGAR
jgi:hypothetical protein